MRYAHHVHERHILYQVAVTRLRHLRRTTQNYLRVSPLLASSDAIRQYFSRCLTPRWLSTFTFTSSSVEIYPFRWRSPDFPSRFSGTAAATAAADRGTEQNFLGQVGMGVFIGVIEKSDFQAVMVRGNAFIDLGVSRLVTHDEKYSSIRMLGEVGFLSFRRSSLVSAEGWVGGQGRQATCVDGPADVVSCLWKLFTQQEPHYGPCWTRHVQTFAGKGPKESRESLVRSVQHDSLACFNSKKSRGGEALDLWNMISEVRK